MATVTEKMLKNNVMGLDPKQFKELIDNGIPFVYQVIAVKDTKNPNIDKFEIHAIYKDVDENQEQRKIVLVGQLKNIRRVTLKKAFEIIREFDAKKFTVVIKKDEE